MMAVPYAQPGVMLARWTPGEPELVQALQLDLRRLGYLRGGLDGRFGPETERAVRSCQYDLLFNDGRGSDGEAPVALREFNYGRIATVNGIVDERLAVCIEGMLDDPRVAQLPRSENSEEDNRRVFDALRTLETRDVPRPFLLAILMQESGLLHFRVPTPEDPDDFIVVGLARHDGAHPDRITSRGYGVGQFRLFHHPPRPEEVEEVMLDPVRNVARAIRELREKFDRFVIGTSSGTRADERLVEIGWTPLRFCRYPPNDPRFLIDCLRCAAEAPRFSIGPETPLFLDSPERFHPTQYHPERHYGDVPDRSALGCDWPYAVRRYGGSGINSYHYQTQVLRRFLQDPVLAALLGS
jgi:hypothetical protein